MAFMLLATKTNNKSYYPFCASVAFLDALKIIFNETELIINIEIIVKKCICDHSSSPTYDLSPLPYFPIICESRVFLVDLPKVMMSLASSGDIPCPSS